MPDFVKGDRVIANQAIGGMLFAKVPKNTEGSVRKVSFFSGSCEVHFDNGETVTTHPKFLGKLNNR